MFRNESIAMTFKKKEIMVIHVPPPRDPIPLPQRFAPPPLSSFLTRIWTQFNSFELRISTHKHTKQTHRDKQTATQTHGHTERKTIKYTIKQGQTHKDTHTDIETSKQPLKHTGTERKREKKTNKRTESDTKSYEDRHKD